MQPPRCNNYPQAHQQHQNIQGYPPQGQGQSHDRPYEKLGVKVDRQRRTLNESSAEMDRYANETMETGKLGITSPSLYVVDISDGHNFDGETLVTFIIVPLCATFRPFGRREMSLEGDVSPNAMFQL